MGKKQESVIVTCIGKSASDVTGSGYLVECPTGEKILLDLGLYQSNNMFESYKANKEKFEFKPKEITACIISHINADHFCMLPRFIAQGGDCNIYISEETIDFLEPMLTDSAKIMERDAYTLSRRYDKDYQPIYTIDDVKDTLIHFRGCTKDDIHYISENVWFKFVSAGHIFGSCQIELFVKTSKGVRKIAYSGDLGNIIFDQPFVENFKPITSKCNLFIGETTYGQANRSAKAWQRDKDLQVMENVIRQTCIEKNGMVLIPTFALQRTETILYMLYKIFSKDEDFNIPIVIDSPLAVALLKCFENNMQNIEDEKMLKKILKWDNVKIIKDIENSKLCIETNLPKVVLSSSGMLTQGRSVMYLKKILPQSNCSILTVGYMAEGSLGSIIKNSNNKTVMIDGQPYVARCDIKSLSSFSSHMQCEQLLEYYTHIASNGCNTIWLVHGDMDAKKEFKKALTERLQRVSLTTKIVVTNTGTTARI